MKKKPSLFFLMLIFITVSFWSFDGLSAQSFVVQTGETVETTQEMSNPGDIGIIQKGGKIVIMENNASGVLLNAENQKVNNSGEIIKSGFFGNGIESNGNNALIVNNGKIKIIDLFIGGIRSYGSNAKIVNNGKIELSNNFCVGIYSGGLNTEVINNGEINTSAFNAIAINNQGNGTKILNNGKISTNGEVSHGIFSFGDNIEIINNGRIATSELASNGVFSMGDNVKVVNNGEITTMGIATYGIQTNRSSFIENNGKIISEDAIAVYHPLGEMITICNNGTIISQQDAAIELTSTISGTLILKNRSKIQGLIKNANAMSSILKVDNGINLALRSDAAWDNIDVECSPYVVKDTLVAVIDRTGFAMQPDILDDLTGAIFSNRYNLFNSCKKFCCKYQGWVKGFGSDRSRSKRGGNSSYDYNQWGVQGGVDINSVCNWNLSLFNGYGEGIARTDHHMHKIETYSFFGGLSAYRWCEDVFLGFALSGGVHDQKNKRKVMNNEVEGGKEYAKADVDGEFFTTEALLGKCFSLCNANYFANASIRYSGLFSEKYKEKGSAVDLEFKKRDLYLLSVKSEISASQYVCFFNENFFLDPYVSLCGRIQLNDRQLKGELLEEELEFKDGTINSLGELVLGVRGKFDLGCIDLDFDAESKFDNKRGRVFRGSLALSYPF